VDASSVEVFGNNGECVITDLVFPKSTSDQVEVFAKGGECELLSLKVWPIADSMRKPLP